MPLCLNHFASVFPLINASPSFACQPKPSLTFLTQSNPPIIGFQEATHSASYSCSFIFVFI